MEVNEHDTLQSNTSKNSRVDPDRTVPYLISVCVARSSADAIGVTRRSMVRKAARLAVQVEIMIRTKNHHTVPITRPDRDLENVQCYILIQKVIIDVMFIYTEQILVLFENGENIQDLDKFICKTLKASIFIFIMINLKKMTICFLVFHLCIRFTSITRKSYCMV